MLEFHGARLHSQKCAELFAKSPEIVWRVLEAAVKNPGRAAYWWSEIMNRVADKNPVLAVELATRAMISDEFQLDNVEENLVEVFATELPKGGIDNGCRVAWERI